MVIFGKNIDKIGSCELSSLEYKIVIISHVDGGSSLNLLVPPSYCYEESDNDVLLMNIYGFPVVVF